MKTMPVKLFLGRVGSVTVLVKRGKSQDVTIPRISGEFSAWKFEVSTVRRLVMIISGL